MRHYAKMFVDVESEAALAALISTHLGVVPNRHGNITLNEVAFDIRRNKDRKSNSIGGDEFLVFPVIIDVESTDASIKLDDYLTTLSAVMHALDRAGLRVVVACPWEARLPHGGRLNMES